MSSFLKKYINSIIITAGIALIFFSFSVLVYMRYKEKIEIQHMQAVIEQIKESLPELTYGTPDKNAGKNDRMPIIDIDGTGYIGILQIESVNLCIPVADNADKNVPYYLSGNAKAESLTIEGKSKEYKKILNIDEGNNIFLTDVRGNVWKYTVEEISRLDLNNNYTYESKTDIALTLRLKNKNVLFVIECKAI